MSRTIGKEVINTFQRVHNTFLQYDLDIFSSTDGCLLRHPALATCLCNNRALRSKDEGLWRSKCAQKLLWVFNVKTQGASSCRKQETKLSIFRCVGVGIRGGWWNWFIFTRKRRGRSAQGALCDFKPWVTVNTHVNISLFWINYQILRKQLTTLFLTGWIKMHYKLIVKFGISFYSSRLVVLKCCYTSIKIKESWAMWYVDCAFKINVSNNPEYTEHFIT